MDNLECLFCVKAFPLDVFRPFCPECGEPLLVHRMPGRPRAFHAEGRLAIEIFSDFLPLSKIDRGLSLGEGDTPLLELSRLRMKYDLPPVFAKNEAQNPTGSFKDRGTVVAVQKARELGYNRIGTISTGNMAGSTAAYAAKAEMKSVIFVKGDTPRDKLLAAGVYGTLLIKVKGAYGDLFRKSFEVGRAHEIYFMNSVDPFRIEGYKTAGFEIFLQNSGRAPDFIFVPVSAGGHLVGLMRAFQDLKAEKLISRMPVFVAVQASGCAPLARAFARGKETPASVPNPRTVAHAISNPTPPGGRLVLKLIQENRGMILGVSEAEIRKAHRLLAEHEGLFCDPASATALAGFLRLHRQRMFNPRSRSVLMITGSGLKAIEAVEPARINLHETTVDRLEKFVSSVIS
jgi:threonine synthase